MWHNRRSASITSPIDALSGGATIGLEDIVKSGLLCLLCLLGATSIAPGFERTIILPDSFGGLEYVCDLAYDQGAHRLYVGGETGDRIVVIDAVTSERVAAIDLPGDLPVYQLACYAAASKLYAVCDAYDRLAIVDCRSNRVVRVIDTEDDICAIGVNPAENRAYCHVYGMRSGILWVIDCSTDSVVSTIITGDPIDNETERGWLVFEPVTARLCCPSDDGEECRIDMIAGDSIVATAHLGERYLLSMIAENAGGRLLCTMESDTDYVLLVVDAGSGAVVDSVHLGDDAWTIDMCYNPVNNRAYCLNEDGCVAVVDLAGRVVEDRIYLSGETGMRLAPHPDGTRLYCLGEEAAYVVDCPTRDVIAEVPMGYPVALAVDNATGLAYCADQNNDVVMVLNRDGEVTSSVFTAFDIGSGLADDDRGTVYLANRSQNNVLVYDAATAELLAAVPVAGTPDALCLNSNHPKLYCSSTYDKLTVIDLEALAVETTFTISRDPESLYYNGVTDRLYCASDRDDVLDIIDGVTNERLATVPVGRNPRAMCVDPVTGRLFSVSSKDHNVTVVNGWTNYVMRQLAVGRDSRSICADPGRRRVYCASYDSASIAVIDADSLSVRSTIRGLGPGPYTIALDTVQGRLYCRTSSSIAVVDCATESVVQLVPVGATRSAALDRTRNVLFVTASTPARTVLALDAVRGTILAQWDSLNAAAEVLCPEDPGQFYVTSIASRLFVLDKPALEQPILSPTGPTHPKSELTLLGTKRATVHDITGRKVADFAPGRNDLTRLPAGIYFIRREGERETAKVVITR
jgi:YVTN family beta-propeller protein